MYQILFIINAQILNTQRGRILFDMTTSFSFHVCPTQYLTSGANQCIQKDTKCLEQNRQNHLLISRPHLPIHGGAIFLAQTRTKYFRQ